ncbi:APC family permease [Companilactobacillus allii]|uniref:Amino acid:proton symporter n=1 Tax=Companilactobacillus allii TaxID=1847728 RepID=A0A1P8Q3D5_9LACO|nr:APC family permease [Companilactobacillus allii]APX72382.1 amino acid:proton symporter [Companilactobacillus allii]USQ69475.1 APC family permease [Companilactobacillus allii]
MEGKKLNLFSTVMFGLSAIIGSGWMFGSSQAAKIAGPAAIIAWIFGAILVAMIAMVYVEIGTMFPEDGAMSRFTMYTHGSFLGHISSWANWLSLLAILPIEAVASTQYMSTWPWKWAQWTHGFMSHGELSPKGLAMATLLIFVFTIINYWSVTIMAKFNNLISVFKLVVPLITMAVLMTSHFDVSNMGSNIGQFMPNGTSSIFIAIGSAGIIYSYVAFQTVINLGNDIQKPSVNIRRGIILSLLISAIIYISLQVVFIGSLPKSIINSGWNHISFNSPFADLAILLNVYWLSTLIYFTAFISPVGSGIAFSASASKSLSSMPKNKHLPKFLSRSNNKYNTPRVALLVDFFVSFLLILMFKNWALLSRVVAASTLISLLTGPVVAGSLRKMGPDFKRPTKIRGMKWLAPVVFDLISLAIYWSMFPTSVQVIIIIIVGLPIYLIYDYKRGFREFKQKMYASLWMIVHLIGLSVISWIGSSDFGGLNLIKYPLDFLVIIVFSTIIYFWAVNSSYYSGYFDDARELNAKVSLDDDNAK